MLLHSHRRSRIASTPQIIKTVTEKVRSYKRLHILIKHITDKSPFLDAIAGEIPRTRSRHKIQIRLEYATRHPTIGPRFNTPLSPLSSTYLTPKPTPTVKIFPEHEIDRSIATPF